MGRKRACCDSIDVIMVGPDDDDSMAYRSGGGAYEMAMADEYNSNTAQEIDNSPKRNVLATLTKQQEFEAIWSQLTSPNHRYIYLEGTFLDGLMKTGVILTPAQHTELLLNYLIRFNFDKMLGFLNQFPVDNGFVVNYPAYKCVSACATALYQLGQSLGSAENGDAATKLEIIGEMLKNVHCLNAELDDAFFKGYVDELSKRLVCIQLSALINAVGGNAETIGYQRLGQLFGVNVEGGGFVDKMNLLKLDELIVACGWITRNGSGEKVVQISRNANYESVLGSLASTEYGMVTASF